MSEPTAWQPRPATFALPLHRPRVTWVLLASILIMFGLETLAGGSTEVEVLVRLGAKVTPLIATGEVWRLFTAMFLHIGVFHLMFNAYALYAIGTDLERLYGGLRFTFIYVLSGLLGSLASYAFSYTLAAGASGAIFGLVGALAAFYIIYRDRLGAWGRARLGNIALLIVINLFLGFTQRGIDNLGHIGGLVGGLALGWALAPRYEIDPLSQQLADSNGLRRYWPALALAAVVLVGGTALATYNYNNNSPRLHFYRGQQAIEQEAWDEAVTEIEAGLAQDPSAADADTYFYLGLAHNNLDQPEQAAAAYEAALELVPDDSPSRWNLALTYLQLGRDAEALEQMRAYLALEPDDAARAEPYINALEQRLPNE